MPVLLERTRATKDQLRAVYAYIRRQREKGKQALAESKAKEEEEKHRKREQEKKKETVEDVKKEIAKLEAKLEELKQKKHDLFSQFKKALNYEDEMRKQQELQAMKAAGASVHVFGVQGLPSGQAALTTSVYPQSALVENTSNSGVMRRQGSPHHPLSGFIQAQINNSQKIQNLQPPSHFPYPPQTSQVHPASQEIFAGFQHGQGQMPIIAGGQQPESLLPGQQHAFAHVPTVAAADSQLPFPKQPPLQHGGLPVQQLQQQQQQQFSYHQSNYQQYAPHGNQKQAFPSGLCTQSQQPGTAQQIQGHQQDYPAQHTQDQSHLQTYHSSNVHQVQAQQSYQAHAQPQGHQAKQPTVYQPQQGPMSGQHTYYPQQQQQPPQSGQYSVPHGHQVQQESLPRQTIMPPQQYQLQQSSSHAQGRQQPSYEGGHQNQQMPPPLQQQQQQQQQQQKQEQRSSGAHGYSQQYLHEYSQGLQGVKRPSHRFNPYSYPGSKGHHQGGAGKKYTGKYQSSLEGTSSSGNYSGSSTHSRHNHHQGRSHKAATAYSSSSSQKKPSRYYQQ